MAEDAEKDKKFKVQDRRTGRGKEDQPNPPAEAPGREEAESGAPAPGNGEQKPPDSQQPKEAGPFVPQVDFSTFLLSLLSSVLIQLGDMPDPITGKVQKDLSAAKQTIDILDVLKAKTQGNLTDEEDRLFRNATAELKWKYLDAIKKNG